MKCTNCGQELNEGSGFCGNCGTPLLEAPPLAPTVQPMAAPVSPPTSEGVPQAMSAPVPQYPASVPPPQSQAISQGVAPKPEGGPLAIAALVLGVIGLIAWLIPIVGVVMGILAILFGSMKIKSNRKGFALTGIILGSIVVVLSLFAWGYNISEAVKSGEFNELSGGALFYFTAGK